MGKKINLIGQKFNKLLVIEDLGEGYWNCQCDCGQIKRIRGYELKSGRIKSCGRCGSRSNFIDLTGKQFGDWLVLRYAGDRKWECQCSCGKISQVNGAELRNGKSKSCGHATTGFKDLTDQKFGEWTALEYVGDRKWKCRCSCGKIQINDTSALLRGLTTRCLDCAAKARTIDITGKQFGDWKVLGKGTQKGYWRCQCSCGNIKEVEGFSLRSGTSLSCGCFGKTPEQRNIFVDVDKMSQHLMELAQKLGRKPSSYEIAASLGVNYNSVNRRLKEHPELKQHVDVGAVHTSQYEKDLIDYIVSLGVSSDSIIERSRQVLGGQELDIYIPYLKLAIEFNGNYWHSTVYKEPKYHQQKTIKCSMKGIRLIHIFEYEWVDDVQREKIKYLLKDIICKDKLHKVGARELDICDLDTGTCNKFLNQYHLQNDANGIIRLGLVDKNNDLISAMVLGKPRFSTNYEYELIRYVVKPGIIVVGGAEKLFNHFISKYNPKSILCYADIAKFTGNIYTRLGFSTDIHSITPPNYVWLYPGTNKVISRYKTTKSKLIESGLGMYGETEVEIMENLGYVQLYDCGNLKFEWRYEA